MDWPMSAPGLDVQGAWVEGAGMVGWGVLIWAGVAALIAVLLLPIATRAVGRRRFWCAQAERDVEVEFEERGLFGFRRPAAVRSCSLFDPPAHVRCRRACLDQDARVRVPMALLRPWR